MGRLMFAVGILVAALVGSAPSVWAQASKAPAASKARATASAPVNLNSATAAQIAALPGIGPKAAQRIIDYRQKNGGFKKIEELMNVKGIGEKSFLKLKPRLSVVDKDKTAAPRQ